MTAEKPEPPLEDEKKSIREDMYETAKKNDVVYDPSKLKDSTPDIKVGLADRWIAKAVKNDPEKAKNVYKALGIDIASVDDAATVARIEQFQKENGLEPDGIPGPKTLEKLDALTGDQGKFDKQLYAADGKPYSAEKEETAANLNSPSGTRPTTDGILGNAPQDNFTNSTFDNGSQTFASTPPSINLNAEEGKTKEKEATSKQEELDKISKILNEGENPSVLGTDYQYAMEGSKLTRSDNTEGVVESWNETRETWETQEGKEEKAEEQQKKIENDLQGKPEGQWAKIESGDGTQYQYMRVGDQVFRQTKNTYEVAKLDGNKMLGDFKETSREVAVKEQERYDLQRDAQRILSKTGTKEDYQLIGANKKVKDMSLGELSRGYDINTGDIPFGATFDIKEFDEKIKPLIEKNPKMAELTLEQFQQFQEKPESFATSDFVKNAIQTRGPNAPKVSNETFVDPEEYGIPSKMVYARRGDAIISKPKEGEPTIENTMIAGPTGEFQTQKKWLETVKVEPGKEYDIYGMPGFKFSKSADGKVSVYEESADRAKYEYVAGNWSEKTPDELVSR